MPRRSVLGLAVVLFTAYCCLFSAHDNDTWWHLRAGELIWRSGLVPSADPFSWLLDGKPWVDFEWLSQLLFFGVHSLAGAVGLVLLKTAAAALAFWLVFLLCAQPQAASALLALAAAFSQDIFLERPAVFDLVFLAVLLHLFEPKDEEDPGPLLWQAPLLTCLWANMHGGAAALGLGLIAAESVQRWKGERSRWLWLPGFCFAAFLLNPSGVYLLAHLWDTLTFTGRFAVAEWQAARLLSVESALILACAAAAWTQRRERPGRGLWLLALCVLAALARRSLPLLLLCSVPAAVDALPAFKPKRWMDAALAAWLLLLGGLWWTRVYAPWGAAFGFGSREDLTRAVRFLDDNGISGKMFNPYDAGGALIGLGFPRRKVFIDSRNVDYGAQVVGEALRWSTQWPALSAKYAFDHAVLFNRRGGYPARALDEDKDWALVYFDDAALVYLRRPLPEKMDSYALLKPNAPTMDWMDAAPLRDIQVETDRALRDCGRCIQALLIKADLWAHQAKKEDAMNLAAEAVRQGFWKPEQWTDLARVQRACGHDADAEASLAKALRLARSR